MRVDIATCGRVVNVIALRRRSLGARSGAVRRARKGSTAGRAEARSRGAATCGCQATLVARPSGRSKVALGRAGDGPKVFPWWEAALVALCGTAAPGERSSYDFSVVSK